MSGGDGAPGWTFEAAGLDFTRFAAADAAHVMQNRYDHAIGGWQDSYPVMSWAGNYRMPANGILWTLFFAGDDFAPGATVDGISVQRYLQDHYLGSMRAVAERVAGLDNVIGFDTLNEPGTGYIGKSLSEPVSRLGGQAWSPLDGLAAASGHPRTIPVLTLGGHGTDGEVVMNRARVSIWLPGRVDPFRAAGAWDVDERGDPVALRPDYFTQVGGRSVSMDADYMVPFFGRVADTVRAVRPDWLIFAELDPFGALRGEGFPEGCPERMVNGSHWYDLAALVTKRFDPERMVDILSGEVREGRSAIEDGYVSGLSRLKAIGEGLNGGAPTLIGECGVQYDMNDAEAYERWQAGERDPEIWSAQTTALELMYNALDRLLLNSTQWNYTASNRNDPMVGDGWNQEDSDDALSGGRAVQGFCRPYARAVQGLPVAQTFDRAAGRFELAYDADDDIFAPTEIYVPRVQYPDGFVVDAANAAYEIDEDEQVVLIAPTHSRVTVVITRPA